MDSCAALEVTPEELLSGRGLDEEEGLDTSQKKRAYVAGLADY